MKPAAVNWEERCRTKYLTAGATDGMSAVGAGWRRLRWGGSPSVFPPEGQNIRAVQQSELLEVECCLGGQNERKWAWSVNI